MSCNIAFHHSFEYEHNSSTIVHNKEYLHHYGHVKSDLTINECNKNSLLNFLFVVFLLRSSSYAADGLYISVCTVYNPLLDYWFLK